MYKNIKEVNKAYRRNKHAIKHDHRDWFASK